jgi:DNA mismatch repair protein MutS2
MLLQLEKEKTSFEVQNKLLAQQLEKAKADQVFFTEMKKNLKERQQEIIKKAKEDARILLSDTNKKIEQTIREIREGQAEKTKTKSLREELKQFEQNLITPTESSADEVPELLPLEKKAEDLTAPLAVGDFVKLIDRGNYAKIEAIEDRELLVSMGQITSRVKKNRVVKVSSKEFKEETGLHQEIKRGATIDLFKKMETFSTQVDFRGKRGEEVMSEIHRMMDTALLLGTHELRIVHGKGDGVLRKLIRSQLKSYPQVVAMTDEHADRGGDGVTLVSLKS